MRHDRRKILPFHISEGDFRALLVYFISAWVLACLAVTCGCGKKPSEAVTVISSPTGTVYEIPVEQVKDKEITPAPGKNDEDVIAVVTVPPSDKPTEVKVYKRPKTITRKVTEAITGDKGSPDYAVTSDNKDIQVKAEKETGLWPWFAGAFAIIGGIFAIRGWLARFGWVVKGISLLRKVVGL